MSEPSTEATPAEKRAALQRNGVQVGSRGKLSAASEAKYDELKAAGKA